MKILKLILLLGLFSALSAQNKTLLEAYLDKDFKLLATLQEQERIFTSDDESSFYRALFERDGDEAVKTYKKLYRESTQLYLKYLAADRLQDYYYARGYYTTAAEYKQYVADHIRDIEIRRSEKRPVLQEETVSQEDAEKYYIQVGAFGIEDNARQMVEMLQTQNYAAHIKIRHVTKKKLFCVWVEGDVDFKSTLKLADQLKQKYHLKYKLIKE